MAAIWGVCDKVFHKAVFDLMVILYYELDEIFWNERLENMNELKNSFFNNVTVAIDCTECPLATQYNYFYSGYKKKKTLKYEIAVSIINAVIVWCPVPGFPGPVAYRDVFLKNKIFNEMNNEELFIGDDHYIGLPKSKIVDKNMSIIYKDKYVVHIRQIVEHAIGRIKDFSLTSPWRHELELHYVAFKICAQLTNIKFRFQPLHKEPHPLLQSTLN